MKPRSRAGRKGSLALPCSLIALLTAIAAYAASVPPPEENAATTPKPAVLPEDAIVVAPPPFSEGIFPCSQCHAEDDQVDRTPRPIDIHNDGIFEHAPNLWCLDCHDAQNRDMLHLANGTLVPFTESYRLCGQCHGPQLRDWKAGDHGKRTGSWSGTKQYLLCASCHNPHSPHFKPLAPLPPPLRQEKIR